MVERKNLNRYVLIIIALLSCIGVWFFASWIVNRTTLKESTKEVDKVVVSKPTVVLGKPVKNGLVASSGYLTSSLRSFSKVYSLGLKGISVSKNSFKTYSSGVSVSDSVSGYRFLVGKYGDVIGFITSKTLSDKSKSIVSKSYKSYDFDGEGSLYIGTWSKGVSYSDGEPLLNLKEGLKPYKSEEKLDIANLNSVPDYFGSVAKMVNSGKNKVYKGSYSSTTGSVVYKYFIDGLGYVYYSAYSSNQGEGKASIIKGDFVGIELQNNDKTVTKDFTSALDRFGFYKTEEGYLWMSYI